MSLDSKLNEILAMATSTEKVAASSEVQAPPVQLTSEDAKGLKKIASLLRASSVEPSYSDLYEFVGGLYGQR